MILSKIRVFFIKIFRYPFTKPIRESGVPGWFTVKELNFLYSMVLRANADNCIEIGTFFGRSSYATCLALGRMGGRRRLICVDLFNCISFAEWNDKGMKTVSDYSAYLNPKIRNMLDGFNFTIERYPFMKDLVEIRACDSKTLNLQSERFGFALIDGDHSYDGVKSDFLKIFPQMKKGGIICFHDNSSAWPEVRKLVLEIKDTKGLVVLGEAHSTIAFQRTG
ncbi:MAG: class I SAM-dependent methyltransferase [Candidatus Ratteibacteria bacterium]|jgi:hypothetical protein